jgi:hypothetical protein
VTSHVKEFVENVNRLSATEVLELERRNKDGKLKEKAQSTLIRKRLPESSWWKNIATTDTERPVFRGAFRSLELRFLLSFFIHPILKNST